MEMIETVIKYTLVVFGAVLAAAFAEWAIKKRKFAVRVDTAAYADSWLGRVLRKFLVPAGLYLLAAAVVLLNLLLINDNVLWGDECFSANTASKSWSGILQVMWYWENHPPLHYYWLKVFGEVLGHTGIVYHFAVLVPFLIGIVFALTIFRKRFGSIPAAFFIMVTGLASSCLQYNLEIRMYSLAFLAVVGCYYCVYRIFSGGRRAWVGMVLWALVGAYTHYYAMVVCLIMMFIACVAACIRYRGKTWRKCAGAFAAFLIGYAPWYPWLIHGTSSVAGSWWMTELPEFSSLWAMIFGGIEMEKIVCGLDVLLLVVILIAESGFLKLERQGETYILNVQKPSLRGWSDETYAIAVGALTIFGTLAAAYILCLIIGPILAPRYLYPLSAVAILMLVICAGKALAMLRDVLASRPGLNWLNGLAKLLLVLVLAALAVKGIANYAAYSSTASSQKTATVQTMTLMSDVTEDEALVSNGVKHLAWTVLYYYFPDNDIYSGNYDCEEIAGRDFWFFNTSELSSDAIEALQSAGYEVEALGEQAISQYPFWLYHCTK